MQNVALIGCGRISARHIEAIEVNPSLQVKIACDIVESKAKAVADKTGARVTTDMMDIAEADIASILTPSGLHPKHTVELAERTEVPIIVTEKPISLTVSQAEDIFRRMEKTGKKFLPVYQNRYNPLVSFIREMIHSGRLGRVYQFICNVLWNRDDNYFAIDWHGTKDLDGGVLYTQASHYVDMLHYFFGEVESFNGVGGTQRNLEVYDSISAAVKFRSGTVGTLNASVNAYQKNYATELTLIAEKGVIHLSGTNLNQISHWNVERMEKPDLDFHLTHEYGKGHDTMYEHIIQENWDAFPTRHEILSGIRLMEQLSR